MVNAIDGHVDAMIINLAPALNSIRAGKLRGLVVSSRERSGALLMILGDGQVCRGYAPAETQLVGRARGSPRYSAMSWPIN